MRFAFETVLWGRRIDDLELVLDIIAAGGFTGVEIAQRPADLFLRNPDPKGEPRRLQDIHELLRLLADRGLTLVSLAGGPLNERVEFCEDFRPEYLYIEQWDEDAERAATLPQPFVLGLHPHWFMSVHRMSQVRAILKTYREKYREGRQLRVLPDTAHLTIVGDDPVHAVQDFANCLAGVHLKDWLPAYGRYSHRYARGFVSLGEGIVRPQLMLQELALRTPDVWVVVEQDYDLVSPVRCVAKCVNWLGEHGYMPTCPPQIFETLYQREAKGPVPTILPDAAQREVKFLREISNRTLAGASNFYQAVVNALLKLGDLSAVQIYAYNAHNEELHLLGMAGLDAHGIGGAAVLKADDANNLCAHMARSQCIRQVDLADLHNSNQFDSPQLLPHLPAKRMVAVPIFNTSNSHHLRFLLKLFPSTGTGWRDERELVQLGLHIAQTADHVTDDVCSSSSALTSYRCGAAASREQFCIQFVGLVKELFRCEGVALFLVNDLGDRLELAGTTGTIWQSRLARHERYYAKGEGLTGGVWATESLRILTGNTTEPEPSSKSWEEGTQPGLEHSLIAPLAKNGGAVVGVIRITNKRIPRVVRASKNFTDDDAAQLDAMIQAVLPHLDNMATQDRQVSALKRMVHEFHFPLVGVNAAVDAMRQVLKEKQVDAKSFFGEDYLSEADCWCKLLGCLSANARAFADPTDAGMIRSAPTQILADVIEPAIAQCRLLLANRQLPQHPLTVIGFEQFPPLYVDRIKFQQVFFNLMSNAIKYAGAAEFRVRIEAWQRGINLMVSFSDWGIGINPAEDVKIFRSGYRSEEAVRRTVAGQGIGLSIVRDLIEAHGGRIRVSSHSGPTTFEIALPDTLCQKPPTARYRTSEP